MNSHYILGINGSPRKANTDILLRAALDEAEKSGNVKTEIIYLRKEHINYCLGCFRCNDENKFPSGCPVHRDSMDEIIPKLVKADGILLASPVYFGGVSAQLKCFMDRTESILRYTPFPRKAALRNKIGAAITVGGNRNGGQETAIQGIHHFFMIHDMIVAGTGPDNQPGCYLGVAGFSGKDPEQGSKIHNAVLSDDIGMRAAEILGRRLAELVQILDKRTTKE